MLLQTERLILFPAGLPILDAMVRKEWPQLSSLLGGVDLADGWTHFPEALAWMRDHLKENPEETGMWSYCVIHRNDVRLIGTCGYKGFPDPDGFLEIGYEIAVAYQNRGLATEAALALTGHALSMNGVSGVMAHTLAEENASAAVLRKLGFQFVEEIVDIEDGLIWRWIKKGT